MTGREGFTTEEARRIGEEIGIEWASSPFDVEQFRIKEFPDYYTRLARMEAEARRDHAG